MTEENDDDIWADEGIDAEVPQEEEGWAQNDRFFDDYLDGNTWTDSAGNEHELFTGDMETDAEIRQTFDTFQEAADYINEILTGADQFFEIVYDDDGYEVWYMGGSE